MGEETTTVANDGLDPVELWIEPWAESIVVPPGKQLRISGRSDQDGAFEVKWTASGVVVYGWPGSTITVYDGNVVMRVCDIPVPEIPSGTSVKGFVSAVFGEPLTQLDPPTSSRAKKAP